MKSLREKFPVYSRLIRLYPAAYYKRFGDEILQTTADMLDNAATKHDRRIIWVKLIIDTTIHISYQQLNNKGGNIMNTSKRIGASLAWIMVTITAWYAYPSLRAIGTEWMNTPGMLRLVYLSLYCVFLIAGPVVMAGLSLFSKPQSLYSFIAKR